MALKTISILDKSYPEPSMDRMKRKQIKKLKPALERLQNEDLDALWDVVALVVPTLPEEALEEIDLGECKKILSDAKIANFDDGNAEAEAAVEVDGAEITAGESSASTNS